MNPIERIVRAHEKRRERLEFREPHAFRERDLLGEALEGAPSWHEAIVVSDGRLRGSPPDVLARNRSRTSHT